MSLFNALFQLLNLFRNQNVGDMYARTGLVKSVKRFVGESAVAHITLRQIYASLKSLIAVTYVVVLFIFALHLLENL